MQCKVEGCDRAATEAQKVIDAALNPAPEVPPEVWQTERPDGERCMAATRAMCG